MSRRRRYEGLRVRLDRNSGEVNLRISYRDLREVFTAAALHCYDSLDRTKKDEEKRPDARRERNAYDNGLLAFVRGMEALLEEEILPAWRTAPLSVEERRKAAKASKRERQIFDDMLASLLAERVSPG